VKSIHPFASSLPVQARFSLWVVLGARHRAPAARKSRCWRFCNRFPADLLLLSLLMRNSANFRKSFPEDRQEEHRDQRRKGSGEPYIGHPGRRACLGASVIADRVFANGSKDFQPVNSARMRRAGRGYSFWLCRGALSSACSTAASSTPASACCWIEVLRCRQKQVFSYPSGGPMSTGESHLIPSH